MKKLYALVEITFLLVSLIVLSGCIGEVSETPSELERFIGTWAELSYNQYGAETVVSSITFYQNSTGTSNASDNFPNLFNYSISNSKILITDPALEEFQIDYEYYFSEDYSTLNIRNTLGGATNTYKKQ